MVGTVIATLLGLLVGLFVVRYREIFFGMLNLAFSMVLWSLLEKMFHYTNGADGMRVPRPTVFGMTFSPERFEYVLLYLTLAIAIAATIRRAALPGQPDAGTCCARSSPTRRGWNISASPPRRVLLIGYVISAALGGIGGVLVGGRPADRNAGIRLLDQVGRVRLHCHPRRRRQCAGRLRRIGGVRTGALLCVGPSSPTTWQLILGVVLIAIILFAPNGLIGLWKRRRAARDAR